MDILFTIVCQKVKWELKARIAKARHNKEESFAKIVAIYVSTHVYTLAGYTRIIGDEKEASIGEISPIIFSLSSSY